ncbi:Gfo/Idh/MocA family protein [Vibrio ziniensis]|uniref:Gfo/Idh/MocA family oxidoreductase n=1 Tax=Vibrio ziniensis TaxID=2711221 RepID=A0A6G7CPL7_9VIBR|nr:Gfo/Idh/MocA family oxidoreductase [Vibrio ziniensis]QIH44024.1 Gfo/Idh/MocA family oxidoreductase [Vibrio ziniensis]
MQVGIVGAGNIVRMCLDAINQIEDIHPVAICVREGSREKGQSLCDEFNVAKLYTDYNDMLADEEIEFIYIGIPNNLHFDYARLALEAGKHVICEKPFTTTAQQLVELSELAHARQLFLFEAITNIHSPNVQKMKQAMADLGAIKLVQGNYSQLSSRYAKYLEGEVHPAFDPSASGGALYDINIYNIHLCCYLFGAPSDIRYAYNAGHNGIDTSGVMTLQYPDFVSICTGAKDSQSPGHFTVQGVNGYVSIVGTPNVVPSVEVNIAGKREIFNAHDVDNHMVYEFKDFNRLFMQNNLSECYQLLQHSITVMKVLEAGRQQMQVFK